MLNANGLNQSSEINVNKEKIQLISDKIDKIYEEISITQKDPKDVIFDSYQLMQILNISKSTLQKLRYNGVIGYSKVLGKHYYKQSDINEMIEKNYKPAFR